MTRLIRQTEKQAFQDLVSTDNGYTRFLSFGLVQLKAGERHVASTSDEECVAVIISGTVDATVRSQSWTGLGARANVFEGAPTSVYVPVSSEYSFTAETDTEIALCFAATDEEYEPFVVSPDEVFVEERGERNWKRTIRDILNTSGNGRVSRIVIGETINAPGDWSSYPPHKHDGEYAPDEPNFEEIYHYRVNPSDGFGVQLHYTSDKTIDDAFTVRDGDTFVIEKGYHPLAAAGGHSLYYLWFMAGDTGRALNPYIDPDFRWLL